MTRFEGHEVIWAEEATSEEVDAAEDQEPLLHFDAVWSDGRVDRLHRPCAGLGVSEEDVLERVSKTVLLFHIEDADWSLHREFAHVRGDIFVDYDWSNDGDSGIIYVRTSSWLNFCLGWLGGLHGAFAINIPELVLAESYGLLEPVTSDPLRSLTRGLFSGEGVVNASMADYDVQFATHLRSQRNRSAFVAAIERRYDCRWPRIVAEGTDQTAADQWSARLAAWQAPANAPT